MDLGMLNQYISGPIIPPGILLCLFLVQMVKIRFKHVQGARTLDFVFLFAFIISCLAYWAGYATGQLEPQPFAGKTISVFLSTIAIASGAIGANVISDAIVGIKPI